jgi:hypothetical protein
MHQLPNFRTPIILLLAGGVFFPIAICVIFGIGTLLTKMGDLSGGSVLSRISMALAILWILDLIALVLLQGLKSLPNNHKNGDDTDEIQN